MHYSNFDPSVRTLVNGRVCKKCQTTAAEKARCWGWFICRACHLKLPHQAAAPAKDLSERCQNCTQEKESATQTCR
eukprot:5304872-Amphidinium_carterae.1